MPEKVTSPEESGLLADVALLVQDILQLREALEYYASDMGNGQLAIDALERSKGVDRI